MIVVTGGYGFIGSCLVSYFNQQGIDNIVVVDDFSKTEKEPNLANAKIRMRVERDDFFDWFEKMHPSVSFIFHLGARTDTTEFDRSILNTLNLEYSKRLFEMCVSYSKPIAYASSAATYGNGEHGYSDADASLSYRLTPLNPYGDSKNDFDKWVLQQSLLPPFWAGFKFFNVYGANEYHKARMASTIFHFFHQIQQKGSVNLFKSHRADYADGAQMRDFVYVKDVVNVLYWFYKMVVVAENEQNVPSGIYNLGTGKAREFNDLVKNVFLNLDKTLNINYIPTPEDIRDKYQYFTEADMNKLRRAGYDTPFSSLEEGIKDYVQNYLVPQRYF